MAENRSVSSHAGDCNCIGCLAMYMPFSSLSEEELHFLQKRKYIVTYNTGETIVKQGSAMTHLACFYSGLAKVYLEGLNGHNLILQLLKKGDLIIGPGIYTDYRHHFSISSLARSIVCFIDLKDFVRLLKSNASFAEQCHHAENLKKIYTLNRVVSLTQKQMSGRIAEALLYLHDSIYRTNPFKIDITRRELGDLTALSKESVIRILKQFSREKVIDLNGSRIEILDMEAIKRFSEVG